MPNKTTTSSATCATFLVCAPGASIAHPNSCPVQCHLGQEWAAADSIGQHQLIHKGQNHRPCFSLSVILFGYHSTSPLILYKVPEPETVIESNDS